MFLVVQDELQLKKICENVDLENFITVFYAGRRITNISSSGVSNWLLFVLSFFKRERPILVCEYANLVPRVLRIDRLSDPFTISDIFESEIQPALEARSFV